MTLEEKCKKLPILTKRQLKFVPPKTDGDIIIPGGVKLDTETKEWIQKFYELELIDKDYVKNIKRSNTKSTNEMTLNDVLTILTWIIRQDRFCDGLLATNVESGTIESLCKRLHEVIQ